MPPTPEPPGLAAVARLRAELAAELADAQARYRRGYRLGARWAAEVASPAVLRDIDRWRHRWDGWAGGVPLRAGAGFRAGALAVWDAARPHLHAPHTP